MPTYRITKPLPEVLTYRGGERYLVQCVSSAYNSWMFAVRREQAVPYRGCVLLTAPTEQMLRDAMAQGFDVPAGGPQERIMESLCRLRYAEHPPLLG